MMAKTNGLDALCAAGLGRTLNEYVLVRAITNDDVISSSTLGLDTSAMKVAHAQEAMVFEIIQVGDKCPPEMSDLIGSFTVSLATSLNPVNGMSLPSRHALVHCETLGLVFSADEVEAALEWVENLDRRKAEAAANHFS